MSRRRHRLSRRSRPRKAPCAARRPRELPHGAAAERDQGRTQEAARIGRRPPANYSADSDALVVAYMGTRKQNGEGTDIDRRKLQATLRKHADAIKKNGNKVWVQEDICVGCGLCQHACEHDAIRLVQIGKPMGELADYFDGLRLDVS